MQFTTTTTLLAITATATFAFAKEQMKLNYYSNSAYTAYTGPVHVTWATPISGSKNNCYNYHYGTSVNIANCYEGNCLCNFYYKENCQGAVQQANGNGNCITNSPGLYSFACYYS